jgi:hypothetical protein
MDMNHPGIVNVDPRLLPLFQQQDEQGGIFIDKLPLQTKLIVQTKHSVYEMIAQGEFKILIKGGNRTDGTLRYPEFTEAFMCGSTWGTTMLKIGWIGYNMRMEIGRVNEHPVVTSPVKNVKIIGPDNSWEYEMQWKPKETEPSLTPKQ